MKREKRKRAFVKTLVSIIGIITLALVVWETNSENVKSVTGTEDFKANLAILSSEDQEFVKTSAQSATIVDVTGIAESANASHDCNNYLASGYNSKCHFKYCTVCGKDANGNYITVRGATPHSFTDHWYFGYASCNYQNYNLRTCSCGYTEKTTQAHNRISSWYYVTNGRNVHYKYCLDCGTWTQSGYCVDKNGNLLSCKNPGTCVVCGNNVSRNSHYIYGDGVCRDCGVRFFSVTQPVVTYNGDRSQAYVSFTITPYNGAYLTGEMSAYTGTTNYSSVNWKSTRNSNGSVSYVGTYTFDKARQQKCICYMGDSAGGIVRVNGVGSYFSTDGGYNWTIWQDTTVPTVSGVTERNISTVGSWATLKELTISGTENLSDVVTIKLIADGKEIYSGSTNVSNGRYSLSITPEIEATTGGKTLIFQVIDRLGNTVNAYYTIKNVDSKAPEIIATSEISEEWRRSKDLSIIATDNGVGNIKIAFNNTNNYLQMDNNGSSYAKTYRLVGDVYGSVNVSIYVKDSLGNVRTGKVKINNIDNTAPTIISATASRDKTTTTVNSNDYNSRLNAYGSGVVGYYYVFDNEQTNDFDVTTANYTTSNVIKNEQEVNGASYIHIKAVDKVGNVSATYNLLVEFSLSTNVNLSAANGRGGVDLEWGDLGKAVMYKAYQRKDDSTEWKAISKMDFVYYVSSITDNSAQDMESPEAPKLKIISSDNNYASLYSNDRGTKYSFYVEAYNKSDYTNLISKTNTKTEIVTTGTKGYYYVIDNNPTNDFDVSKSIYTTDDRVYLSNTDTEKYLHVKAVDYAGNVSDVSNIYISFDEAGNLIKTASWIDANNAIAQITLTARFSGDTSSVTSNKPIDMIIVQDTSNAMATNNKLNISKEMTKNLVNKVFDTVPDTRVALIQFGSSAEIKCGYVDSSSRDGVINAINNLNYTGNSSYGLGLQKAIELINAYTNINEKEVRIVFVTDGKSNQNSKGTDEAKKLKQNYGAKIYGVEVGNISTRESDNIKNICDSANYINIQNSDYMAVYNKIFKNVVSYSNREIICTDEISEYFNIVSIQNGASMNNGTITWNVGEIRTGEASLKINAQLKDEYRYFDKDLITKYATNNQAILNYKEKEVVWGSQKGHFRSAISPELNYVYVAQKITVKVSENKPYHGTEYFGLFTDTNSTKAIKYQSITYSSQDSTTFSVMPGIYYVYMVDSNGNKLSDSNIWYYEVESTEGYVEEITDGFKIGNHIDSTISQTTVNKPENVYNDILTVVNTHNKINLKRIWLNIAGNVKLDSNRDGNLINDVGMQNITVILHTINSDSGKEELLDTKTDENGAYSFKDQDIAYKHYVEFKYNGEYYEPTIYKAEGVTWEASSKAVDKITQRREFNEKFEVISSNSESFTRNKLKADNVIDQYGNLISNASGAEENFAKKCIMAAYTGYNENDQLHADVYVYKTMKAELGYDNYNFTQFINLGLVDRQEADIAISEDIFGIIATINGKNEVYEYNKKSEYKTAGIYEVDERATRGYYNNNYTREIYKADYDYEGENKLEIYVAYQIAIKNKSSEIAVVANELVNYYDEDYIFQNVYLGDSTGKKIETKENLFETGNRSKYGTTNNIEGYKTLYIRNAKNKIKITAGGECYIYVTFKVDRDEKLKIEKTKANIVELNSYSTYYYIDNAINKDNLKTQKEYEPGDVAGIVDKDSTPGNLSIRQIVKMNKDEMLTGKSATELNEKYNLEDDSDFSPSLKITYENDGEILQRYINGTVWEDERNNTVNFAQIGNGLFDDGENKVEGVTVELVKQDTNEIIKSTITDQNGNYTISEFIPDNYFVKFTYGQDGGKYNGQDYKSTIYTKEVSDNTFDYNQPDKDDLYNLKIANDTTNRESDARDYYGRIQTVGTRLHVNDYSNNSGNGVTNRLATTLSEMSSDEFKENTYMTARSAIIDIQIEYDRNYSKTSTNGSKNKGNSNYDLSGFYKLDNLDFGIVERPKSQLELTVDLTNVKVTLSNGQVLFDASGQATNVMWIEKTAGVNYYTNNFMKVPTVRNSNNNGKVMLTMDSEIMHGATVKLTYKFSARNIGEVDYTDTKFYYVGIEDKPYTENIEQVSDTNISTTTANTIISYIGNQKSNNLQFVKEENDDWSIITARDLSTKKLIAGKLVGEAEKFTTIIKTDALGDKKLVPILVSEEKGTAHSKAILVETITPQTSGVDRIYSSMTEIVKTSNDEGRRMQYSVAGNQNPAKEVAEVDSDTPEEVIILPPFGNKRVYYMLAVVVATILIGGIVCVIYITKHK